MLSQGHLGAWTGESSTWSFAIPLLPSCPAGRQSHANVRELEAVLNCCALTELSPDLTLEFCEYL